MPSLSESKSKKLAIPSLSVSHKVCVIKISSNAKSFPSPPILLLMKITLKVLTFSVRLAVKLYQSPERLAADVGGISPVFIVTNTVSLMSLISTFTFGRKRVAMPGASERSKLITQKLY